MERKLLFSISARAEERGPEAKKGLIPESWGPFKKALFLLQRWEGAGSVCRWERAAEIKQPFELPLFPPLSLSRYLTACLLPLLSSPPPPPS